MKRFLASFIGSSKSNACTRKARSFRPDLESLEDRLVLSTLYTDMTELAMGETTTHSGATRLYLNFDGDHAGAWPDIEPFTSANRDRDIQEILFKTSELFAPFNIEVRLLSGYGNYSTSNGNTTIFVGNNTLWGDEVWGGWAPLGNLDFPNDSNPNHVPNSHSNDVAVVDPFKVSLGNRSNASIARNIAHEAGHTFGLAHVLSAPDEEMMSYDAGNARFINKAFDITDLNANFATGNDEPLPFFMQPTWTHWHYGVPHKDNILTQNAYTYLEHVLGERSTSQDLANVADLNSVDTGAYINGTPVVLTVGGSYDSTIDRVGDYDVFQINNGGFARDIQIDVKRIGNSTVDPIVLVYDDAGQAFVAYDNNGGTGLESRLTLSMAANTSYKIVVGSHDGTSTGQYRISVSSEQNTTTTATGLYNFDDQSFTISASAGDDAITIDRSGSDVTITVNSVSETLSGGDLDSINIDSGGNDTITITGSSSNVTININNAASHGLIFDSGTALQNVNLDGNASISLQGTNGNDVINIRRYANDMDIQINGVSEWLPLSDVAEITLFALGGNDTITVHSVAVDLPIIIYAGSGDDTVKFHTGVGLDIIDSTIHVYGGTGANDVVEFNDAGTYGGRTWNIGNGTVSRTEMSNVFYNDIDRLKIRGNNYADTFIVGNTAAVKGVEIDGAYGSDELVAPNMINDWKITGSNAGNLDDFLSSTGAIDFKSVESLTGGSSYDYFKFLDGDISGNINGGGGTYDVLSYKDHAPGITVNLESNTASLIGGVFSNIERFWGSDKPLFSLPNKGDLIGGGDFSKKPIEPLISKDTIVGRNTANTWNVTDNNEGSVANNSSSWSFEYFENLIGGDNADVFRLSDGKGVTGKVDGKGGIDTLDYTDYISQAFANLADKSATNIGAGVFDVEEVVDADPSELQAAYGFYSTGDYLLNWGGWDEKWFKNQDGDWYFITPDGSIYQWDGADLNTSTRIAMVETAIFEDLALLFDADAAAPYKTAFQLQSEYGFHSSGDYYQNWGGWQEKWFKDQIDNWFFITESGRIYQFVAGADLSSSTLIARTAANVYTDLSLLFDAMAIAPYKTASELQEAYGFHSTGDYYQNWGGWQEKWFKSQDDQWFFITAAGRLYEFAAGADLSASTLIARVDMAIYNDLSLLFDPMDWPHMQAPAALKAELGFYSNGDLLLNWGGWEEKWFMDKDDNWYFITVSGRIYEWDGGSDLATSMQIALVGAGAYEDLSLLLVS